MTDTAGYSDQVFGLFRLLGYQFSPRLADIGSARFWRITRDADYDPLNGLARHQINTDLISAHWDDLLHRLTARNFNPLTATAGRVTIVEADHVLDDSFLDPDQVMTPGIFVQRLVRATDRVKPIENGTVCPRPAPTAPAPAGVGEEGAL